MSTLKTALISATPTLLSKTALDGSDASVLTISNIDRNPSEIDVRGKTVPANQAITFTVSGGTGTGNGTTYLLKFTVVTDEDIPQTIDVEDILIWVKD